MKKGIYYLMSVCVVLLLSAAIVEATVITSLPYTITTKGYYTINSNLKSSGHGIVVNTDNVTIDLKGYTISGNGTGNYHGIYMNGRSNVEIKNGTVRNFGSEGIYEENDTSGNSHRVINVRVIGNHRIGIHLSGNNHLVEGCNVSFNSLNGILTGKGSMISGNTVYNNGWRGIETDSGCTISGNTAYTNGASGIAASSGSTVQKNTVYSNQHGGIYTSSGCTISGNTAYNNGYEGISTFNGCTVKNNTAFNNQWYGIYLDGYSLVDGNTAYNNNQSAGGYSNISACGTCVFGTNCAP